MEFLMYVCMYVCMCMFAGRLHVTHIEGRWHSWLLPSVSFILCIHCDHGSVMICTVMTIYTSVSCTDGVIILMCPCMQLFNLACCPIGWLFMYMCYAYIIYAWRYKLIIDLSMSQCMDCVHHYITIFVILKSKNFFLVIYAMNGILIICCILMYCLYCPVCTRACYHIIVLELSWCYAWMFILAIVLLPWVMTGIV